MPLHMHVTLLSTVGDIHNSFPKGLLREDALTVDFVVDYTVMSLCGGCII